MGIFWHWTGLYNIVCPPPQLRGGNRTLTAKEEKRKKTQKAGPFLLQETAMQDIIKHLMQFIWSYLRFSQYTCLITVP